MLTIPPPIFRRHHKAKGASVDSPAPPPPPPVGPPILLSGLYSDSEWVRLTFDRAVNIDAIEAYYFDVFDPHNGILFEGNSGATLIAPETVEIILEIIAPWSGSQTLLNAAAGNGIVSAIDASPWAGVSGFVLEE